MLTRTEILSALRKMGYSTFGELKRRCREYEKYATRIATTALRRRASQRPPS
ncbi:MAG: hypothetical protein HY900_02845 [Deltaproteobacteria bacterium]|nr:hypothetical protein [Deltaproteobacteria bacterium]